MYDSRMILFGNKFIMFKISCPLSLWTILQMQENMSLDFDNKKISEANDA